MDETLKRKAYHEAMKLKSSGLDQETIYARLEKQGIPEDLARQAAADIMVQRIVEVQSAAKVSYNIAIIRIAIGVGLAIISYIIVPDVIVMPIGFILTGIILAINAKSKM